MKVLQKMPAFAALITMLFVLAACGNKTGLVALDEVETEKDTVTTQAPKEKSRGFLLD
tara:strand:- start:3642 stop:3815 length:174 start_codon:yes stop_codon:yes gene_type:complete